jgi:ankyrin repeat protein
MRFAAAAVLAAALCALAAGVYLWQRSVLGPQSALARAAHQGDADAVRALIAAGASAADRDARGNTPLHWAARGGHTLGPHRCGPQSPNHLDTIEVLLAAGADARATDAHGWTPARVAGDHHQDGAADRLARAAAR